MQDDELVLEDDMRRTYRLVTDGELFEAYAVTGAMITDHDPLELLRQTHSVGMDAGPQLFKVTPPRRAGPLDVPVPLPNPSIDGGTLVLFHPATGRRARVSYTGIHQKHPRQRFAIITTSDFVLL